jgi:hypothetical protein
MFGIDEIYRFPSAPFDRAQVFELRFIGAYFARRIVMLDWILPEVNQCSDVR